MNGSQSRCFAPRLRATPLLSSASGGSTKPPNRCATATSSRRAISVKLQAASAPKLTALGTTLGSPYYMSPEQATGKLDLDSRTDVFALAAIMHELATGQVAFPGENVAAILMKIVGEEPPPVSARSRLHRRRLGKHARIRDRTGSGTGT